MFAYIPCNIPQVPPFSLSQDTALSLTDQHSQIVGLASENNMRQVQPETLPKNSNLLVYKISSLKITPPKTPNSRQFLYPLPNIVSFLFEKKID
jgi:hypothetical protein